MKYIYCIKSGDKVTYVGYSNTDKPSRRVKKGEQLILVDAVPDGVTTKQIKSHRDAWRVTLKCATKAG